VACTRGRRGSRRDPRHDGHADGLRAAQGRVLHQPLRHRPSAAEAEDPRHGARRRNRGRWVGRDRVRGRRARLRRQRLTGAWPRNVRVSGASSRHAPRAPEALSGLARVPLRQVPQPGYEPPHALGRRPARGGRGPDGRPCAEPHRPGEWYRWLEVREDARTRGREDARTRGRERASRRGLEDARELRAGAAGALRPRRAGHVTAPRPARRRARGFVPAPA
jgi:hypothetical protein